MRIYHRDPYNSYSSYNIKYNKALINQLLYELNLGLEDEVGLPDAGYSSSERGVEGRISRNYFTGRKRDYVIELISTLIVCLCEKKRSYKVITRSYHEYRYKCSTNCGFFVLCPYEHIKRMTVKLGTVHPEDHSKDRRW